MLTKKDLQEFKKIWLAEFGEVIDGHKAEKEGQRLINLFHMIYRRMPIEKNENQK